MTRPFWTSTLAGGWANLHSESEREHLERWYSRQTSSWSQRESLALIMLLRLTFTTAILLPTQLLVKPADCGWCGWCWWWPCCWCCCCWCRWCAWWGWLWLSVTTNTPPPMGSTFLKTLRPTCQHNDWLPGNNKKKPKCVDWKIPPSNKVSNNS